jgi:hypothetical protein
VNLSVSEVIIKQLYFNAKKHIMMGMKTDGSIFEQHTQQHFICTIPAADSQKLASARFAETASWKVTTSEATAVPEPNSNPNLVGPTISAGVREFTKQKFSEPSD